MRSGAPRRSPFRLLLLTKTTKTKQLYKTVTTPHSKPAAPHLPKRETGAARGVQKRSTLLRTIDGCCPLQCGPVGGGVPETKGNHQRRYALRQMKPGAILINYGAPVISGRGGSGSRRAPSRGPRVGWGRPRRLFSRKPAFSRPDSLRTRPGRAPPCCFVGRPAAPFGSATHEAAPARWPRRRHGSRTVHARSLTGDRR